LYTNQRRWEEARRCFQGCEEALADSDYDRALLWDRLGALYLQTGDLARAVALGQASRDIFLHLRRSDESATGLREWQAWLHLGESYLAQGQYAEAEGECAECEKMGQQPGQPPLRQAQVGLLRARIRHAQGQETEAGALVQEIQGLVAPALNTALPGAALRWQADCHLFLGDLAMDCGDWQEAAREYGLALQWADRFAKPFAHQRPDLVLQRLEQQAFAGDPLRGDEDHRQVALTFCQTLAVALAGSSLEARLANVIQNLTQSGLALALAHLR
jgi:tetratricopeptide (TPR) repeat protein